MCGIFGYAGKRKNAAELVFEGIKKLEYRGYDSWGIAVKVENQSRKLKDAYPLDGKLFAEKHIGKIGNSNLKSKILNLKSSVALGHTRWATHGGVTVANAHPHFDCGGKIALVHNGIVENYLDLKRDLIARGHKFASQTDTEVVVHLVEELCKKNNFREAVRRAFLKVKGLNAFIFLNGDGEIIAVKNGSPLVIGVGNGENIIASDPVAIVSYTKNAIFLEDMNLALISKDKIELYNVTSGKLQKPKITKLNLRSDVSKIGKFKHYMIKEICDQPKVLGEVAAGSLQISKLAKAIDWASGIFFIGCGSASYAALAGTYIFSKVSKKHVNFSIGSEFFYLESYLNKKSLVIAVSQSGETVDVIQPVLRARARGAKIAAMTNVLGSSLYRNSDFQVDLGAGVEKAVCATKSFSAMAAVLILLSYTVLGKQKLGRKVILDTKRAVDLIFRPDYIRKIKELAKLLSGAQDIYLIGRGLSYAAALEAALKLKEVSYIHSEGFAGGELKHGVIALVERGTPCVVFAPNDETYDDIISNAIEIKARGGYIIGISSKKHEVFDFYLPVADCAEGSIIAGGVPIQLLTYFIALERGLDPDMPRNLAKSVTVK